MDLREFNRSTAARHPWETARLKALAKILRPALHDSMRILDVGCGDGYIVRNLFERLKEPHITAVDIHLTDDQLRHFNRDSETIRYTRDIPQDGSFDLVLLLDVLEHIQDDSGFLAELTGRSVAPGGTVMITVPAFQSIFGLHDVNLGHYRRYRIKELHRMAQQSGLSVVSSGYLFASLLLPKYLLCTLLKIDRVAEGVGHWNGGKLASRLFELVLNIDNGILMALAGTGIRLPGLTGWVLCKKPA